MLRTMAGRLLTCIASACLLGILPVQATTTVVRDVEFRMRDLKVLEDGGKLRVRLQGGVNRGRPGEPELPVVPVQFEIPAGSRVSGWRVIPAALAEIPARGQVAASEWLTSTGRRAGPSAAPAPSASEWFPSRMALEPRVGFLQGHSIASIPIQPVQVLPGEGRLRMITRMRVELTLEDGGGRPLERVRRTPATEQVAERALGALQLPYRPRPNAFAGRHGAFPQAAGEFPGPFGREAAYIILTPDSLIPAFQPLADWKTRQGISARVVGLSTVQSLYPQGVDLQEKIRYYIRDSYLYSGTIWVLLGGTVPVIPVRYATSALLPDSPVPTDAYFGNLDGNWNNNGNSKFAEPWNDETSPGDSVDFYPEVYVGRAPILNSQEAGVFVGKTLTYDQAPPQDYLNNHLLFCEVLFPADYSPGQSIIYDGTILGQSVADSLPSWSKKVRLYENYPAYAGSYPETRSIVVDSLNRGYNLALHIGHGFRNTMSTGPDAMVNADIHSLVNGPRNSYLISVDCTSGAVDFDCIGAASVTNSLGGAFAFWGSTREAFPAVTKAYLDTYMSYLVRDSILEIGQDLALCKLPFASLTDTDNPDRWTQLAFILLGDPSLRFRMRPGPALLATSAASFTMGDPGYTVTVTCGGAPSESALVCVQKAGDDLRVGYTNASGQVSLPFQPDNTGPFQITATKRNCNPYQGAGSVVARGTAYLYDFSSVKTILDGTTFPQNGNGDGFLDAGETVQLRVVVGNNGNAGASGVVGLLSTTQAGVTITAPSVSYGSVGANSSSVGTGYYTVTIARSVRDGLKIPFNLNLSDVQGDVRDDYFTLTARAPVAEMFQTTWSDSVVGPTHYAVLRLKLRNLGSGSFRALTGTVRPIAGSYIGLDSISNYGNLAPGASGLGSKSYRFQGTAVSTSRFYLYLTDAYGAVATLDFNLKAPGAPQSLSALGGSTGIQLSWAAPVDSPTVAGYYIYRSTSSGGPFARVNSRITTRESYYEDFGLSALTQYFYYVTAADSAGNEGAPSSLVNASTNPPRHTGWPITTGNNMAGSPILLNLDHSADKSLEIMIGSDGFYAWHPDGIEVRDGDGQPLTSGLWLKRGSAYANSIAAAVLYEDARLYIAGVSLDSSWVFLVDENGNMAPGWPKKLLSGFTFGSVAFGDIDGDGKKELVVATGANVYAWRRDGVEVRDGDNNPATNGVLKNIGSGYCYSSPALADLDGDGKLDIIIGASDAKMHAIRYNSTEVKGFPVVAGAAITGSAAVADIDLDGHLEVIFPSTSGFLYCLSDTGTAKPGWPVAMTLSGASRSPSPAIADMDHDGYPDIVEATTNGYIKVYNRLGVILPGWSNVRYALGYPAATSESSPIVADVNGDGAYEVFQGAEDAFFYGFRQDGTTLPGFPIRVGGEIRGTPAIWDLTNSGAASIVLPSWDKKVYVWDYPGGFSRANAPWPMFRHDDAHTGLYNYPNVITATNAISLDATADEHGLNLRWEAPPAAEGPVTWNLFRRELAGDAGPGSVPPGDLRELPADFQKLNDLPIVAGKSGPGYLDGDVRGGETYSYILETLVNGQRQSLAGPLVRRLPDQFLPARTVLFAAAPNPFRNGTALRYQVPVRAAGSRVRMTIHDVAGRVVRTLVDAVQAPGSHTQTWDGRDDSRTPVAAGVYFYRLDAGGERLTRKVMLVH